MRPAFSKFATRGIQMLLFIFALGLICGAVLSNVITHGTLLVSAKHELESFKDEVETVKAKVTAEIAAEIKRVKDAL
jgi:hypothetical protein